MQIKQLDFGYLMAGLIFHSMSDAGCDDMVDETFDM